MKIQLLTGWLVHTPGTVLDLGRGQAELLIARGIAEAVIEPQTKAISLPRLTKHLRSPAETK
jgi:hypothetical protein